jgi:hypothetical protein
MKQLRKLIRLQPQNRRLLASTFVLLGAIRLGLKFLPFPQLLKSINRISVAPRLLRCDRASIGTVIWAVEVSTFYMPGGAKCLARALTTQVLMHRAGYDCELKIGVSKTHSGQIEAHAWIEYNGQVIIGHLKNLHQFIPLPSLMQFQL